MIVLLVKRLNISDYAELFWECSIFLWINWVYRSDLIKFWEFSMMIHSLLDGMLLGKDYSSDSCLLFQCAYDRSIRNQKSLLLSVFDDFYSSTAGW